MAYAHSRNKEGRPHDLIAHLQSVAATAGEFGRALRAAEAARFLGLWHDIGKFAPAFQQYLAACEAGTARRGHGPDHKAAGALLASQHLSLAALLVQGHHGGLKTPTELQTWLRQHRDRADVADALRLARSAIPEIEPGARIPLPAHVERDALAAEFFLRLLFSALVDADHLDTERHFAGAQAERRGSTASMPDLWERFQRDQERLMAHQNGTVNEARRAIYQACLDAAERPPGLFRLAVPTGGGKTRSGMAFALRHALRHGHQRVIVAVPFITITEQTADVYRDIFGTDDQGNPIVLEHHSSVNWGDDEEFHPEAVWTRLAAENWDAPIVVTTTVQLFESLFANTPSRCRKLHRLARSVIILDEAQVFPPHLLKPMLDALRQLTTYYGTTVVISTATQPAFDAISEFANLEATEIVPEPGRFFRALQRVTYEWHTERALSWSEVADLLRAHPQGLAVVNTKKNAWDLLDALGDEEALHLSTLLCGAHRRAVIAEVRERLAQGRPCRLVSTQLIEAGVDLDFPLVARALGPLDSIVQAAGRCNREGRLARGRVVVFRPAEGGTPPGWYRAATQLAGALIGKGDLDMDDPATSRTYFKQLFETLGPEGTDAKGIQSARAELHYPRVAERFRMIEDDTESVVVSYGSAEERRRIEQLLIALQARDANPRFILRQLQPYMVALRRHVADRYRRIGFIEPVADGLGRWLGDYDEVRGLAPRDLDPDALVV